MADSSGYFFFQMPHSKWFGIVPKDHWEKHHCLNEEGRLCNLLNAGFPMQDFTELRAGSPYGEAAGMA